MCMLLRRKRATVSEEWETWMLGESDESGRVRRAGSAGAMREATRFGDRQTITSFRTALPLVLYQQSLNLCHRTIRWCSAPT